MREPEINPVILFTTERWAWEGKPLTAVGPNIVMTKLAEVASKAADPARADVGDSIDRGLIVLRLLKEAGFELRIAAAPPQEERSDPLYLAAADDNRPADLAAADAAVARIMAMSDEEIMAEPGAAERAVEAGKVIAHAVALHDIRTVRDKLQAAFDDQDQAPGVRNFSGGLAEHLTDALAALSQPADDNHKALVGRTPMPLADGLEGAIRRSRILRTETVSLWVDDAKAILTILRSKDERAAAFQSRQEESR